MILRKHNNLVDTKKFSSDFNMLMMTLQVVPTAYYCHTLLCNYVHTSDNVVAADVECVITYYYNNGFRLVGLAN